MNTLIENPTSREIRAVIRFLNAKNLTAAEILCHLFGVYGPSLMIDGRVRWIRQFKDDRTNTHHEDRIGCPPIVSDDLVEKVSNTICENQRFTISELWMCFPQISLTLLYEILAERLHCRKVSARWMPIMLTDEQRNQRMSSAFTFLQWYHSEGEKFLDHFVAGDGTWISCSNIATQKQSVVWKLSGSLKLRKFEQTFCGRKLMATGFGTEEVFCWWYS
jgi:histone-lysine N-methyltransferase SETMAR